MLGDKKHGFGWTSQHDLRSESMNVPFPDPLVHFAPIRGSERQPVGAVVKPSVRFLHSRRGNRQCSSTMRPHDGPNRSTRNPGNRLFLQMTAPVGSVLAPRRAAVGRFWLNHVVLRAIKPVITVCWDLRERMRCLVQDLLRITAVHGLTQ